MDEAALPPPAMESRRKRDDIFLPFLLGSAVLLIVLYPLVDGTIPFRHGQPRDFLLAQHQAGRNAIIAQKLITPSLPSPPQYWPGAIECKPVRDGVWLALGKVTLSSSGGSEASATRWGILFRPETGQIVQTAVGADETAALVTSARRAGANPSSPY